jgi:DNA adenine methylase
LSNPVLKYNGGKAAIAEKTIAHFPPRSLWRTYAEPFGGAYSIGFAMRPVQHEFYNDIDEDLANFFRVYREQPIALCRKLDKTLHAQSEYDLSKNPCDDPLERARRFYVRCWQGFGANKPNGCYRKAGNVKSIGGHNSARNFRNSIQRLREKKARFANVHVSCEDWHTFLARFEAVPDALIYIDPPYERSTRKGGRLYRHELMSPLDHALIAAAARRCAGYVVVAGYASPLYASIYESHGWARRDIDALDNAKGKRVESIWLNPKCVRDSGAQSLFS